MANVIPPEVVPKVLVRYASWATVMAAVESVLPAEIVGEDRKNYVPRLAPDDLNDPPKLWRALVEDMVRQRRLENFMFALYQASDVNSTLRKVLSGGVAVNADGVADEAALQTMRNKVQPFVNSKTFLEGIDAASYRVCAVWVDDPLEGPDLKGTGFLVAPDLVLTARHVVRNIVEEVAIGMRDGLVETKDQALAASESKLACVFDFRTAVSKFDRNAPPTEVTVVPVAKDWLEWSSVGHREDGVTHVFGPPEVSKCLDCAIIRLSSPIGAVADLRRGGKPRGWLQLNGATANLASGERIAILQHPGGQAQNFAMNDFRDADPTGTRIWYETDTSGGSSGSPCFDSGPRLVGFHNAGWPTHFRGTTERCNQGVRIDPVVKALPPALVAESRGAQPSELALWSLASEGQKPEPIIGRSQLKQAVVDLFKMNASQRLVIVEEASQVTAIGKSGKSFSTRILKALARGRPALVVEFDAEDIRGMMPEEFLREFGRRIDLGMLDNMPAKPTDERQLARWWSTDLPQWFGDLVEGRGKDAGSAVADAAIDRATGPASGRGFVLREIVWIAIDNIHRHPPEGGMKELLAGMMGITDTEQLISPGLKSLRWLVIGHVPDFVRERSIEYVREEISQDSIGMKDWVECIKTAFRSKGIVEKLDEDTARDLYDFSRIQVPEANDPAHRLAALAKAIANAIEMLFRKAGIS